MRRISTIMDHRLTFKMAHGGSRLACRQHPVNFKVQGSGFVFGAGLPLTLEYSSKFEHTVLA